MLPSDIDLLNRLKDLDESDEDITSWECDFIENVVYKKECFVSDRQRQTALKILEEYEF